MAHQVHSPPSQAITLSQGFTYTTEWMAPLTFPPSFPLSLSPQLCNEEFPETDPEARCNETQGTWGEMIQK